MHEDNFKKNVFKEDRIQIEADFTPTAVDGDPGMICWDENFIYVCVAPKTWKKVALVAL